MRFYLKQVLIFLGLLATLSCTSPESNAWLRERNQWMLPTGKLKVLSTIAMINDLVSLIGGEHVDALTLIKGDLDPHSYQLVKGDDELLFIADLIFYNGLGLEHGPSLKSYLRNSLKSVPLGDRIQDEDPEAILTFRGQLDPHIWMDISLWAKTVPHIVETLSSKDPSHADVYKKNGEKLLESMQKANEEVLTELHSIPEKQRYLVTSHDAFNYFTRSYLATEEEVAVGEWQKRFQAPEGLAPESQLSSQDIQFIINHLSEYQIHVVFPESNVSKDSIRKIVKAGTEKGMKLQIACVPLYADAMGSPGSEGDTYLKMIRHNAFTIAKYLRNNLPPEDCEKNNKL